VHQVETVKQKIEEFVLSWHIDCTFLILVEAGFVLAPNSNRWNAEEGKRRCRTLVP
jgi:hypothetical protein